LKKPYLEAINGEKTAEDAFLETRTQHYHIILFIHGDLFTFGFTDRSSQTNRDTKRERRLWFQATASILSQYVIYIFILLFADGRERERMMLCLLIEES
jgi:hypothetical protein